MGKGVTGKHKSKQQKAQHGYLRMGVLLALVAVGVGTIAGMAALNRFARPNRDMKWYMQEGTVEIAAPAMDEAGETEELGVYAADVLGQNANPFGTTTVNESDGQQAMVPVDSGDGTAAEPELPQEELPQAEAEPEANPTPTAAAQGGLMIPGEGMPTAEPVQTMEPAPEIPEEPQEGEEGEEPEEEEDDSGVVTITISAAGDCTFGGEIGAKGRKNFTRCVEKYGLDYFFSNVRYVFEDDDLTIVNLEGPLTKSTKGKKHGFVFKGDPEYVNILTGASVELCNVANNHTLDYGKAGLKETAEVLDTAGVGYCGFTRAYNADYNGVRVCSLGFTWWDFKPEEILAAISEARAGCDLLIVNIHWGVEGKHNYTDKQAALAHKMVDAGADLIIGTHPHVYQGIEKYKGKYIVYSLGNFCFAGNANPADKRCLIFQQRFSFTPGMGIEQAGIVDEGINIIPCTVSSVKNTNNFQPTVMGAEEGAELLKKVAGVSPDLKMSDVRWMRGNYLLANGLIKPQDGMEVQPAGDILTDSGDVQPDPDESQMAETDALDEAEALDEEEEWQEEDDIDGNVEADWPLNTSAPENAESI